MIKCLLVDDESPAIDLLKNHLQKFKEIEIVASCYNALEALAILKKEKVDLIFLDIEMPVLKGLDFLKSLQNPPKVIITTAYREYALEGYDLDVIDYLLKPISFDRFVKAIERFYNRQQFLNTEIKKIPKKQPSFMYVNVNKKHIKIIFNEVLFIESLKDYVRIHTKKERIVVKGNIGRIEELLPKEKFLRIHRSYIVSLDKVTAFTHRDVEIGEIEVPIGSSYYKDVFQILSLSV